MGSSSCDDGEWTWPEGLAHYVERHSVLLPDEFVATMRENGWRIPSEMVFSSARRKGVGFWASAHDSTRGFPDPRHLVRPGWCGNDLDKILSYLRMEGYVAPRAKLNGREIKRLWPRNDLTFWLAWAHENGSDRGWLAAGAYPVIRREWLVAEVSFDEWLHPLQRTLGAWLDPIRSQIDGILSQGGQLWTWRSGSDPDSGAASGLVVIRANAIVAEWWIEEGNLPEFAGRSIVRPDGTLRPPFEA
jgi:hypothetical protein